MKKVLFGVMLVSFCIAGMNLMKASAEEKEGTKAAAKAPAYYVCAKCHMMAMQPGKCRMCGDELKEKNLLATKDGTGYFCDCASGCKCTLQGDDASKCSCGKAINKVSLKGMYICNCGPACKCDTISDKPGKCSCASELKKVE